MDLLQNCGETTIVFKMPGLDMTVCTKGFVHFNKQIYVIFAQNIHMQSITVSVYDCKLFSSIKSQAKVTICVPCPTGLIESDI